MHPDGLAAAGDGRKDAARPPQRRARRAIVGAGLLFALCALHRALGPGVPLLGLAAAFVQAAWPLWHRQREEAGDVVYESFVADWRVELLAAARVALLVLPAWCIGAWLLLQRGSLPSPSARAAVDFVFAAVGQWLTVAAPEEWFWRGYVQPALSAAWPRVLGARRGRAGSLARLDLPLGAVLATALFAASHLAQKPPLAAAATFVPGLLFAWLYRRRARVLGASVLHALCNATSAALL